MLPQDGTSIPNARYAGTSEFTAAVRAFALTERGVPPTHPVLAGRLARRVGNAVADGLVPSIRINGRYVIDIAHVPLAADVLGLTA